MAERRLSEGDKDSSSEHCDATDWPRDFDVRAQVAEQAEWLENAETLDLSE